LKKNIRKFSVAILGLGDIGMGFDKGLQGATHVYTHARAFDLHPGFSLVGAYDPNPRKRAKFRAKYKKPVFSSAEKMFKEVRPEVVVVASPTSEHKKSVATALRGENVLAILCEKPMAANIEDSSQIVQACKKKRKALFINFIRRADPGILEVKEKIKSRQIKGPFKSVVWYSKGLLHNGSHYIDLMTFWFGPIHKVSLIAKENKLRKDKIEADCRFDFDSGSVVFLAAKEKNFSHYTSETIAKNGRLRLETDGTILWQVAESNPYFSGRRKLIVQPEVIRGDMVRYQLNIAEQLYRALVGKKHALCSGSEALTSEKWIHKILRHEC
jgi:predicted dehydrogenase